MSSQTPRQLLLGIKLDDDATFGNFYCDSQNQQIVHFLKNYASIEAPRQVYLWGSPVSGRTHLLQAVCHGAQADGRDVFYLPLGDFEQFSPAVFEGLEALGVICLDDLDRVAGQADWELALFNLYHRARESGALIIAAGRVPPPQSGYRLADLVSRLQWSTVYRIPELDDAGKAGLLKLRAERLGIDLDPQVADYILLRSARSVRDLLEILARLDTRSLEARRAITVPLVKSVMGW